MEEWETNTGGVAHASNINRNHRAREIKTRAKTRESETGKGTEAERKKRESSGK